MNTLLLAQFVPPPPDASDAPQGEVCYENIGPQQRSIRARFGSQAFVAALLLAAVLLAFDAAWFWRLLVFFPLAVAITNWLQARERTWLTLAALGQRNMDTGEEKIEDRALRNRLRLQGLWIAARASAVAALVAALIALV